jgi:hypothetical protein
MLQGFDGDDELFCAQMFVAAVVAARGLERRLRVK